MREREEERGVGGREEDGGKVQGVRQGGKVQGVREGGRRGETAKEEYIYRESECKRGRTRHVERK